MMIVIITFWQGKCCSVKILHRKVESYYYDVLTNDKLCIVQRVVSKVGYLCQESHVLINFSGRSNMSLLAQRIYYSLRRRPTNRIMTHHLYLILSEYIDSTLNSPVILVRYVLFITL